MGRAAASTRGARLGVEGEILGDFEYTFIWDFGGVPGDRNRLFEASVSYQGLDPVTVVGGAFEPSFSLQQERDAAGLLFFERATVVRAASRIAAGSGRLGAEARANGERWFASAALTGGRAGPGPDGSQRGAVARVAGRVAQAEDLAVHLGLSGTWSFRPPRGEDGQRTVAISENAELSLDPDNPLDTGAIRSDSARVGGVEFGASWRGLQVQGEWYRIEVDRAGRGRGGGGGALGFSGWYAQASWVLHGQARRYRPRNATWGAPKPDAGGFDPAAGGWGALEIGARVSEIDLNDAEVRGGRQRVWSAGLGWWPVERIGAFLQYQHVDIAGLEAGDRSFQAVAVRALVELLSR